MSDNTVAIVYRYTPEALAEPAYLPDVPPRDLTELDLALMPPDIVREVRGCKLYTAVEEARANEDAAATGQPAAITVGEDVPPDLLTPDEHTSLIEQQAAEDAAVQPEAPKKTTKKGGE